MTITKINDWVKGDKVSARKLNEMTEVINQIKGINGNAIVAPGGLTIPQGYNSRNIRLPALTATAYAHDGTSTFQVGEFAVVRFQTVDATEQHTGIVCTIERCTDSRQRPICIVSKTVATTEPGEVIVNGYAKAIVERSYSIDQLNTHGVGYIDIAESDKYLQVGLGRGVASIIGEEEETNGMHYATVQIPPVDDGARYVVATAAQSGGEVSVRFCEVDGTAFGEEFTVPVCDSCYQWAYGDYGTLTPAINGYMVVPCCGITNPSPSACPFPSPSPSPSGSVVPSGSTEWPSPSTGTGTCGLSGCDYKVILIKINIGTHASMFPFITNGNTYAFTLNSQVPLGGQGGDCAYAFTYNGYVNSPASTPTDANGKGMIMVGITNNATYGNYVSRMDFIHQWYCGGFYIGDTSAYTSIIPGTDNLTTCNTNEIIDYSGATTNYPSFATTTCGASAPTGSFIDSLSAEIVGWL